MGEFRWTFPASGEPNPTGKCCVNRLNPLTPVQIVKVDTQGDEKAQTADNLRAKSDEIAEQLSQNNAKSSVIKEQQAHPNPENNNNGHEKLAQELNNLSLNSSSRNFENDLAAKY